MDETEIVFCPCGHDFEAFANDIGTYQCPKCFDRLKTHPLKKLKPLDAALKEIVTMMKTKDQTRIQGIFSVLNSCKLNSKQEEIIESLEKFYQERGYLTDAQKNLLDNIYEKASS